MTKELALDIFLKVLTLAGGYLLKEYQSKKQKKKLQIANSQLSAQTAYYPQIMALKNANEINECVDRIFEQTSATRFLILVGVNGKEAMQHVSVILPRTKGQVKIDPKIYQNLKTDKPYVKMLKFLEKVDEIVFDVFEMPRGMLKSIYYKESISHSILKFIARTKIDKNNDAFVFSSIATDTEEPISIFDKIIIDKEFELIKKYLKNE